MDTSSLVEQLQLNQITSLKISYYDQLRELGGIEGLMNLLRHNSSVARLDLSVLYIGPEGAKRIAQLLQHNNHLLDINLFGNSIGDEGAKAVAEAMKVNSTLQTIDLSNNWIGDEEAKAVAEAIKLNSTLQTIYLGVNMIGAEGAKAVAEAIKVNSTLQTIDLRYNSIGAEGAKAVAEALKVNLMLETVDVEGIDMITTFQVIMLVTTLDGGYMSITPNLVANPIGRDLKTKIAETLQEIRARKEMNYRKFICAFTAYQVDSACLGFDKMMLRYVYYPILGVSEKGIEE
jgi:hypothetical protein